MASIVQFVEKPALKQSQIVDDLRRRIISGEFAPGSLVPSLTQMEKTYSASRKTVQSAMHHLRDDGFVFIRSGKGRYVSERPPHLCRYGIVLPYGASGRFFDALRIEAGNLTGGQAARGRQHAHQLLTHRPHPVGRAGAASDGCSLMF